MYKKGRLTNPNYNINLVKYIDNAVILMRPILKRKLKSLSNPPFINTRELDDLLCEDMKDNLEKFDGKQRWIEIHKNIRVRIISTTLIREFGYIMWSGNTRKVLCKPVEKSPFKTASEIKNEVL